MPFSLSDYDLAACVRKHRRFQHQTLWCRSYSKYNPVSLKSDLNNFDMPHIHKIETDRKRKEKRKRKTGKSLKTEEINVQAWYRKPENNIKKPC